MPGNAWRTVIRRALHGTDRAWTQISIARTREKKREAGECVGQSLTSDFAYRVYSLSFSRCTFLVSPERLREPVARDCKMISPCDVVEDPGSGSAISALLSHVEAETTAEITETENFQTGNR